MKSMTTNDAISALEQVYHKLGANTRKNAIPY